MEKYILLSTFTTLTQEELELTKDWEETPLAVVAITQEYIERWVLCPDYKSLGDFLDTSTYDMVKILAAEAECAGLLAFTYRPSLEPNFEFPEFCRRGALAAFADYLSSLLNKNGHMEAFEYLDALLEMWVWGIFSW